MAATVTQEELRKNLSQAQFKAIQGKTVTPYVIAEEGISHPKVIQEGQNKALTWPRAVIRRVSEIAKAGTKLFTGHNSDNSTEGRKSVGEVVGSFSRVIGGKLQALAITVLMPNTENMDVCSIEANADWNENGIVTDVSDLTGIALGSSQKDSPAFAGAVRMAQLQCFDEPEIEKEKIIKPLEKGDKEMTFAEVEAYVKANKVYPHQLFDEEMMKKDRFVGDLIIENNKLKENEKVLNTKIEDQEKAGKEITRQGQLVDAKDRFKKLIPEGTTEKSKEYLIEKFDPEKIEDLSDVNLKKIYDSSLVDYAADAKRFGVDITEEKPKPAPGAPDADTKKSNVEKVVDEILA